MTKRVSDQTLGYNCKDVIATFDCASEFMGELDKPAAPGRNTFRNTYDHTLSVYEPCMYMQSRGMRIDLEALEHEKRRVGERIGQLQEEINRLCGREINPNSSQQLQKYFYIEKGIHPYTKLDKNKQSVITCDDKALQRIARGTSARAGLREAALIQEWRKLSKLKGTYLEIRFDDDRRMRSSYNPRGTRFARLSSSKTIFETGMNQQNLHPDFLSFIVADPGCMFVSLDKRQAEWVIVAYASGDASMISAVEQGLDVHAYTAHRMTKVPMDIIKAENKAIGHTSDPDEVLEYRRSIPLLSKMIDAGMWMPRSMSMRQCGKKSNHGLNYDESYKMFAIINELTEKDAKWIVEFYHTGYPGIRRWYEWTKQELQRNNRVLHNMFGRPYRFLGPWDKDLWKSAYSYNPQSTVGEMVNRGMVDAYFDKSDCTRNLELMQQVHDNILFQIPINDPFLGEAILKCKKYLEPKLTWSGREFVVATDMKLGVNLGNMIEVPIVEDGAKLAESMRTALANWYKENGGDPEGGRLDNGVPQVH